MSRIVVEIDSCSGFCFGVVNAISTAQMELRSGEPLYCLGEIVHNSEEVERLRGLGLVTITHADLDSLEGKRVLLRAHGEPPQTYRKAMEKSISIVDASCPVVLKLQTKVREGWERMKAVGGQVIIFGKKGHAEVVGLVGQTDGNAVVVESLDDLKGLDFSKPTELFSQTTKDSDEFRRVSAEIHLRMQQAAGLQPLPHYKEHYTICGQVANRKAELTTFAQRFNLILFVSGKSSSNGKMLFEHCKLVNSNTRFISNASDICAEWFAHAESVGICGATSTPRWLMEQVAQQVERVCNSKK